MMNPPVGAVAQSRLTRSIGSKHANSFDSPRSSSYPLISCTMNATLNHAPNLTQRPPRSPRVRLGGYVVLARILDKGRAELAATAGEFKYNNPGDYHWVRFTGITPEALKAELAKGKGDGEVLAWIEQNALHKRTPWEI